MEATERLLHLLDTDGQRLHRLLARLTLRAEAADDLLQELFLKLRTSAGFRDAADPAAFAMRAAVNLVFDWRRKCRRRREVSAVPDMPTTPDPLAKLVQREELDQVLIALTELSESARLCLVLRHLEQLATDDIARQLGKTPHQVRALCAKGVARLRQRLGQEVANG
ncbi:MAG: RNA polymerase sigma factor [Gemmataceae bacterium]